MALTDLREPHDSQVMKNIRVSFVKRVSGDLHVLQVTYSTRQDVSVQRMREMRERANRYSVVARSRPAFVGIAL